MSVHWFLINKGVRGGFVKRAQFFRFFWAPSLTSSCQLGKHIFFTNHYTTGFNISLLLCAQHFNIRSPVRYFFPESLLMWFSLEIQARWASALQQWSYPCQASWRQSVCEARLVCALEAVTFYCCPASTINRRCRNSEPHLTTIPTTPDTIVTHPGRRRWHHIFILICMINLLILLRTNFNII